MEIYESVALSSEPTAVALGFFDGVHSAHTRVIKQVCGDSSLCPTVMTFSSAHLLPYKKRGSGLLQTDEQKLERFEKLGIRRVYLLPFSEIALMEPRQFIEEVVCRAMNAKRVACGYDYRFGAMAAGDAVLLSEICSENGVDLRIVPQYTSHGVTVSSTAIREALANGELSLVNEFLGYPYYIKERVVHGRSLGRTLGFPTLNQPLSPMLVLPKFGVYQSRTKIDGIWYRSITNIGVKPTIEGVRAPLAETYLLDASGDFYGMTARVELFQMMRPEQKFSDVAQLKEAVHRDIARRQAQPF